MKQRERGRGHGGPSICEAACQANAIQDRQTKSPATWRGFRFSCCSALAVLALLAALAGAVLLLLLAGLLAGLTTLLLLTGLRLLAGLIALLLLAWVLVGILILAHSISFQRWLLPALASKQRAAAPLVPQKSCWNRLAKLGVPSGTCNDND